MTIPEPIIFTSVVLGRELARAGYGLISGGWPGVDHTVCREYVTQLRRDETGAHGIGHVVQEGGRVDLWADPAFAGEGDLDAFGSAMDAVARSIDRAHGLITVGGGTTLDNVKRAMERRLPIFPVASTGGDSEKAFGMLSGAPDFLRRPIRSRRDARQVVRAIIELLPPAVGPTPA